MSTYERYGVRLGFGHDRITWSVQAIIVFTTAVFAAQLALDIPFGGFGGAPGGWLTDWVAFSTGTAFPFVWTLVTYMFLHGSLMHLFINMLQLYFFGPEVERALGTRQFFYFYLLCGAGGVLFNFVSPLAIQAMGAMGLAQTPPLFGTSVIGASGATMGVLCAFAMLNPQQKIFLFPIPIPITARWLVIFFIFTNIMTGLQPGSSVSVATHLGGIAVGAAFMKFRPEIGKWRWRRKSSKPRAPSTKDMEKLGEEIDNILRFQDKGRH